MATILFTSTHETSFILDDLHFLRQHFAVERLMTRGWCAPCAIARRIRSADVTFTWFASVYAWPVVYLGNLLGKRTIVAVGGADLARVDEAGYGMWRNPWKSLIVQWILRHAWRVIPVDDSLRVAAIRLGDYDGQNIRVMPTGYDPQVWSPDGHKESLVLTVAACESSSRVRVKGIHILAEAARALPHLMFLVIGPRKAVLGKLDLPGNLRVLPPLPREELLGFYRRAAVYCQPSLFEGLPGSLCEAMLCGCVPVASAVGGMPHVIGDTGFLVAPGDVQALGEALSRAVVSPASTGDRARQRISMLYPKERRERELLALLEEAVR